MGLNSNPDLWSRSSACSPNAIEYCCNVLKEGTTHESVTVVSVMSDSCTSSVCVRKKFVKYSDFLKIK